MSTTTSPPYPIFFEMGDKIREKWRRIDEITRDGTEAPARERLIQQRDQFEALVKDIDLYHVNEPQPGEEPRRYRLHEAAPRMLNDILGILEDLDKTLATGIGLFETLESMGNEAGAARYPLVKLFMDRVDARVSYLGEYASDLQTSELMRMVIPGERFDPTRSIRSLREWLQDTEYRLPDEEEVRRVYGI